MCKQAHSKELYGLSSSSRSIDRLRLEHPRDVERWATLTFSELARKSMNPSTMATKASDQFERDDNERKGSLLSNILNCFSTCHSRSNTKTSQTPSSNPPAPTGGILKLLVSCTTWCHKIQFPSRSSRSPLPTIDLGKAGNNDNDGDQNIRCLIPASLSTPHFSNTSRDCASSFIDKVEHSGQLHKLEESRSLNRDFNHAVPYHADHFLDSKESLSLQTIYDGEIFGRDYGSTGTKKWANTEK